MKNTSIGLVLSLILGASLLGAAGSAFATSDEQISLERIVARGDYYIVGGIAIDDLDALETAVRAVRPNRIELDACGPDAAHAWKAAVQRFGHLPLQVQVLNVSAPACAVMVARRVSQRGGTVPTGIDGAAVDRYWRQVAP